MKERKRANLSDTRGNRLGFAFFRVFMRVFGVVNACRFAAFPALFYALFDREAFFAARGYLKARFPEDGNFLLRWRFFRQNMSVAAALILQHAVSSGCTVGHEEAIEDGARRLLEDKSRGAILLLSHLGCWQAALPFVGFSDRRVNLLIQTNLNENVAAMFDAASVSLIDNAAPFGGLLECKAALERGELISIMGDREAGERESGLEMRFCGRTLRIPASPWLLAARLNVGIIPVFPVIDGRGRTIKVDFMNPIFVSDAGGGRGTDLQFADAVSAYARLLERVAAERPYQIYHYSRINAEKGKEQENG